MQLWKWRVGVVPLLEEISNLIDEVVISMKIFEFEQYLEYFFRLAKDPPYLQAD